MIVKPRYRRIKRVFIVLLMLLIACWGYVEWVNRNSKNMSLRQKVIKAVYPLFSGFKKITGKGRAVIENKQRIPPPQSFYDLTAELNSGDTLFFSSLAGKKILLVNTASDCGYTPQYAELQKLFEQYQERLIVIGFPANDFKEQEKGSDEEIALFCKRNYGVTFPITKKTVVVRGPQQHPVYQWLTDAGKNGWNNKAPSWNFSKYIINEQGMLTHYFGPAVSPLSREVLQAIN
jgi:glutathione peroxidase